MPYAILGASFKAIQNEQIKYICLLNAWSAQHKREARMRVLMDLAIKL